MGGRASAGGLGHRVGGGRVRLAGAKLARVVAEAEGGVFHAAGNDLIQRRGDEIEVAAGEQLRAGGSSVAARSIGSHGVRFFQEDGRDRDDGWLGGGAEMILGSFDNAGAVTKARVDDNVLGEQRRGK